MLSSSSSKKHKFGIKSTNGTAHEGLDSSENGAMDSPTNGAKPTSTTSARTLYSQFDAPENETKLSDDELLCLYGLVHAHRPRRLLEIGTFSKSIAPHVCRALDENELGDLVTVDATPNCTLASKIFKHPRWTSAPGISPQSFGELTKNIGGKFDFVYIDAKHRHENLAEEIASVLSVTAEEAYIVIHGCFNTRVSSIINEVCQRFSDELVDCGRLTSVAATGATSRNGKENGLHLLRYAEPCPNLLVKRITPQDIKKRQDGKIPVIIALSNVVSGVNSWAINLREQFKHHPKYEVMLLSVGKYALDDCDIQAKSIEHAQRIIRRMKPAIVLPNYLWELFLLGFERKIHFIGMCHADSTEEYYRPLSWNEPFISKFIGVSKECSRKLSTQIPSRKNDIFTLPYGVEIPNIDERSYQCDPIRIAYGGRIIQEQKRVFDFVNLTASLKKRGLPFQFSIVGDGPALPALKKEMKSFVKEKLVTFYGRVAPNEMQKIWSNHDVFVQVSDFEGTSVSMLEAMAHGTIPVVTRASSGIDGILQHGKNGFIVPVGDMEKLADCIAVLCGSTERQKQLGRAAHNTAGNYSLDIHARKVEKLFDRIIHNEETPDPIARYGRLSWRHPLFKQFVHINRLQQNMTSFRERYPAVFFSTYERIEGLKRDITTFIRRQKNRSKKTKA